MSDDTTARLGLPLLQPGQAQKEMTHNETLAQLDLAVQAAALAVLASPPSAPVPGQCWIVGSAATGAWSGHVGQLAGWTAGGWRFLVPSEGMTVWLVGDGVTTRYYAGSWHPGEVRAVQLVIGGNVVVGARQAAIASPSGGTTIDTQARATLTALLATARAHGLIAS